MSFLYYKKPLISSLRHVCLIKKLEVIKNLRFKDKNLLDHLKSSSGRNKKGRLTFFKKGCPHKRSYRNVTFNRLTFSGVVESVEHDPSRTSNLIRVFSSETKKHIYFLAPLGLRRGHSVSSQFNKNSLKFFVGNTFFLKDLPLGSFIFNILFSSLRKSGKTGVVRSAGCCAILISKNASNCRLRLPSGEHRLFSSSCFATLGIVSNPLHKKKVFGKAGRSRWLGKRPSVRGVAMNPIDHPHGGGNGKTSGGRPSVTPWGKLTKGKPTRKTKQNKNVVKKRIK